MSAATAQLDKKESAKFTDLRNRISELERDIERIEGSLGESRRRRENLVAERGPLVLPARSQKNAAAQNRLHAIDEQLPPTLRNIADDEAALAELTSQLMAANNGLVLAEWESERAKVRKLLAARLESKIGENLEKAARDLAAAVEAAAKEDERVLAELFAFEPRLRRENNYSRVPANLRGRVLGFMLRDCLPIDRRELIAGSWSEIVLQERDEAYFGTLLEDLNRMELIF
jgi:chromosome segregation ATPase